jgi:predicted nucleic acid-binding protein
VLHYLSSLIDDNAEFYTSTITDAEFLVKPFSDNNITEIQLYKEYLMRLELVKCAISEQIAEKAALIRAKYKGIKLADSLQIASCINSECDEFLTNDKQLKQVTEVGIVYLGDL